MYSRAVNCGERLIHSAVDSLNKEGKLFDSVQVPARPHVDIDRTRDQRLTEFGKATLSDRYLMPGESFQDLFARVASRYGDDHAHAQRLYDYISNLWLMPATPVPVSYTHLDVYKRQALTCA